jgi:hypothetical protein
MLANRQYALMEAWESLEADYELLWSEFDRRFNFRASVRPEGWPAITEPPGSTTINLDAIFSAPPSGFAAGASAVNALVLRALVATVPEEERLVVLDWQHASFGFWPHRHARNGGDWCVQPFPNGDYYAFLSEDMRSGTFGHPWERSLCVFGEELSDALLPTLTSWLPTLRSA